MNKIIHKSLISFLLFFSIIVSIATGTIAYMQYNRLSNTYYDLIQSYQTIRATNQTIISLSQAALNLNTFFNNHDTTLLSHLSELIIAAEVNFAALRQLISDNNLQIELANTAAPLLQTNILALTKIINQPSLATNQPQPWTSDLYIRDLTSKINNLLFTIKQEEVRQLNENNVNLSKYKNDLTRIIQAFGALSGLLFLLFLFFLNRYLIRY